MFAAIHGYIAAWLAIRMLFRPRRPVKLGGLTVWPQGMIPRHRERLAQSIGNAVGNELVSQDTVLDALFATDFFRDKIHVLVGSLANDLLARSHPSFLDALPAGARAPVLEGLAALQLKLAAHISAVIKSEETTDAITGFVNRRVDEILARDLNDTVSEETFNQALDFIEQRFRNLITEESFAEKIRDFVGGRLIELANSRATLAETFTPETIAVVKERVLQQVPPIVRDIAQLATSDRTRGQIGSLIKREVDDYYEQLSFVKKIFISRERIHQEVDDLVNKTLPRRIEQYLRDESFAQEAATFLSNTIDDVLARPLNELIGTISADKIALIRDQVTERVLALVQSPELTTSVSAYANDALARVRPHSLRAILAHAHPEGDAKLKKFLTNGLLSVLTRDETLQTVNAILSAQIERLLVAPIGDLSAQISPQTLEQITAALTARITETARERLPAALAEFNIGGIVRRKVADYPAEKLEALVLSIAAQHLRKIELFGAVIGFFIGVLQAVLNDLISSVLGMR